MGNLFKLSYWFNPAPGPWLAGWLKVLYAFFVLLFIMGLVASWMAGRYKDNKPNYRLWKKVQHFGLGVGLTGVLLILIRQEGIYFLSMPVWMLLLIIGMLVWLYFIIVYAVRDLPVKKERLASEQIKKRYLPR